MPDASQSQMSHADRHDLDKLARWKEGLDSAADSESAAFPVCAIFLVSPEDRASHDIFRRYRSAFEELGGGFHHLVIFGQHGVSTTQVAFLAEVGMQQQSVPLLALAPMSDVSEDTGSVYCLELPKGDRDGNLDDSQTWGTALERVRVAVLEDSRLSLEGMEGVKCGTFHGGSLSGTVDGVLRELGGEA